MSGETIVFVVFVMMLVAYLVPTAVASTVSARAGDRDERLFPVHPGEPTCSAFEIADGPSMSGWISVNCARRVDHRGDHRYE